MPPPDGDAAGAARGARGVACFLLFLEEASLLFVLRFLPMSVRYAASKRKSAPPRRRASGTHALRLSSPSSAVFRREAEVTRLFFSLLAQVRALASQHGDCAFAVCRSLPGHADTLARPSYPLLPQRSQWYPRFARTPRQAAQQAAGRKALKKQRGASSSAAQGNSKRGSS